MGKVVIKCAKCGNDQWTDRDNARYKDDKFCSKCGATYCAKNRKWEWID